MYKKIWGAAAPLIYLSIYYIVFTPKMDILCNKTRYLDYTLIGIGSFKSRTRAAVNFNKTSCYMHVENKEAQEGFLSE